MNQDSGQSPEIFAPERPGIVVPRTFRRIGQRGLTWGLPRTFPGYFADATKQVLGASTKYVIRHESEGSPEYLIKYAQKHGIRETLTEFFINQLGLVLGLNIAHSGIVLADGVPTFITRIFVGPNEVLRHGSLIIEDCFRREKALDVKELDSINRRAEQEFYSIDFVIDVLRQFCGEYFTAVLHPLLEMLVFDALIGSMDRHSQNWGVLVPNTEPLTYRFAPIFDTARALLWSLDEEHVKLLSTDEKAFASHVDRARPCMGPVRDHPKVNRCNHFDFVANLLELYPEPVTRAIARVSNGLGTKSARILRKFPFSKGFTGNRKRLILKILTTRANRLNGILGKGGF